MTTDATPSSASKRWGRGRQRGRRVPPPSSHQAPAQAHKAGRGRSICGKSEPPSSESRLTRAAAATAQLRGEDGASRQPHSLLVPLPGVGRVGLRRDGLDHDGHEAVEGAAELGALAVEDALALDEGGDAVDPARGGVRLDAEGGHGPAVEHVLAGHKEADVRPRGQRQALVHLEVPHHARLQVLVRHEVALELVEGRDLRALEVLLGRGVVLGLHVLELRRPRPAAQGLRRGGGGAWGARLVARRGGPEEGLQRREHLCGVYRGGGGGGVWGDLAK
eukprot:CAMPEP_0204531568 /NCGR_PEP_ID=MMETSP0661-20131031/11242_1 /ASSEMBLY_ACC=CAM_ASM_000606 /TAXON_ID=109239 /ORGANISM="Alexandrium margalefi, Strain AMGDE01CS-322" /LENGTH=276 /DNA_ID=CAMNT_0051537733 /DNA_START=32 /DNA_END=859 /DNA_ORIENTATION=+